MRFTASVLLTSALLTTSLASPAPAPVAIQDALAPRVTSAPEAPRHVLEARAKRPKIPKGSGNNNNNDCTATITTTVGGQTVTTTSLYDDDECTATSSSRSAAAQSASSSSSRAGAARAGERRVGGVEELALAGLVGALGWLL